MRKFFPISSQSSLHLSGNRPTIPAGLCFIVVVLPHRERDGGCYFNKSSPASRQISQLCAVKANLIVCVEIVTMMRCLFNSSRLSFFFFFFGEGVPLKVRQTSVPWAKKVTNLAYSYSWEFGGDGKMTELLCNNCNCVGGGERNCNFSD